MNDELQKQLAALLESLMKVASDAGQFAQAQIPPLVQEKIALGRIEETANMVPFLAFGLALLYLSIRYWGRAWQLSKQEEAPVIAANVVGLAVSALCIMPTHTFWLVWFAPRLYIVEWLKTMVTK